MAKAKDSDTQSVNKIQQLREALILQFMEREELIDGMLTALISRQPLLQIGPPGTAKSLVCETICKVLNGKYFSWMVGKLTTPEELFGPLSLKGLEQDRYTRNSKGKLPDADIVFLDEVFKGSSAILNTLLTNMNERVHFDDGQRKPIPMQTLFGASNELPQAEELAAMYDRFALRYYTEYLQEDANVEKLFTGLTAVTYPSISLDELKSYQDDARKVTVSPEIVQSLISLRRSVNNEGLMVSDRKWVQAVEILKSYAWLNGNQGITDDDMIILINVLWATPEQRATVRKLVGKVSNPISEKILQHQDAAVQLNRDLERGTDQAGNKIDVFEIAAKMKDCYTKLEKMVDKKKPNKRLDQALVKVKTMYFKVARDHLKINLGGLEKNGEGDK